MLSIENVFSNIVTFILWFHFQNDHDLSNEYIQLLFLLFFTEVRKSHLFLEFHRKYLEDRSVTFSEFLTIKVFTKT